MIRRFRANMVPVVVFGAYLYSWRLYSLASMQDCPLDGSDIAEKRWKCWKGWTIGRCNSCPFEAIRCLLEVSSWRATGGCHRTWVRWPWPWLFRCRHERFGAKTLHDSSVGTTAAPWFTSGLDSNRHNGRWWWFGRMRVGRLEERAPVACRKDTRNSNNTRDSFLSKIVSVLARNV